MRRALPASEMKQVYPDFFREFHCIADRCRHSCCVGWEIDIDEETLSIYEALGGELTENISYEDCAHFRLTPEERCPFLNERNLCRLILRHGEEILCDICREHPRFYNSFTDREEVGLGLCCEEAARLLLSGTAPLVLCSEGEEESEEILLLRDEVLSILASHGSLTERMHRACTLCGVQLPAFRPGLLAETMAELEILDPVWRGELRKLSDYSGEIERDCDGIAFERIAEYFVYRHFASGGTEEAAERLLFAFGCTQIVAALTHCGTPCAEALRMLSSEIEYAEENQEALTAKLTELP